MGNVNLLKNNCDELAAVQGVQFNMSVLGEQHYTGLMSGNICLHGCASKQSPEDNQKEERWVFCFLVRNG